MWLNSLTKVPLPESKTLNPDIVKTLPVLSWGVREKRGLNSEVVVRRRGAVISFLRDPTHSSEDRVGEGPKIRVGGYGSTVGPFSGTTGVGSVHTSRCT